MRRWMWPLTCLTLAAACAAGCTAQANPNIDPRADAALRRMSATLAAAKSFKVHSSATIEERTASGQMAQFMRDSTMLIGRPDRLQADVRRGPDTFRLWHQGKELTILDVRRNQYTVIQTPAPIAEMVDFLANEYDIVVPLDDLLQPDPYKGLVENVNTGDYVDQQEVGGRTCDHLAFTQDNVNWQIWIDAGPQAVPLKVVITYKDDPDHPQFEAVLSDWQFDPPADATAFAPQLAEAARRVEIAEFADTAKGE